MTRSKQSFGIWFIITLWTAVLPVLAKPNAAVLELPFDKLIIFSNGEEERIASSGMLEGENIILKQVGRPDLILPWSQIKAILPVLPKDDTSSVEDLRKAITFLRESRDSMPDRAEVSDQSIRAWENRVGSLIKLQAEEKNNNLPSKKQRFSEPHWSKQLQKKRPRRPKNPVKLIW